MHGQEPIIQSLIRGITWGIASTSSRREYSYSASQELYLYNVNYDIGSQPQLNSDIGCMTLVAGDFAFDGTDCVGSYDPLVLTDAATINTSLVDLRGD